MIIGQGTHMRCGYVGYLLRSGSFLCTSFRFLGKISSIYLILILESSVVLCVIFGVSFFT